MFLILFLKFLSQCTHDNVNVVLIIGRKIRVKNLAAVWKYKLKGSRCSVCHELWSLIILNDVCAYWFRFQRIGKRMKDLAVVWSWDLLSEVLIFFTLVFFSINLIAWSLIDGDFGFRTRDLVC